MHQDRFPFCIFKPSVCRETARGSEDRCVLKFRNSEFHKTFEYGSTYPFLRAAAGGCPAGGWRWHCRSPCALILPLKWLRRKPLPLLLPASSGLAQPLQVPPLLAALLLQPAALLSQPGLRGTACSRPSLGPQLQAAALSLPVGQLLALLLQDVPPPFHVLPQFSSYRSRHSWVIRSPKLQRCFR